MLGSIDTNNKGTFEVTAVNHFLESIHLADYVRRLELEMGEDEVSFLYSLAKSPGTITTTARLASSDAMDIEEIVKNPEDILRAIGQESIPEMRYSENFCDEFAENYHPDNIRVASKIKKFTRVKIHSQTYCSVEVASAQGSYIHALFVASPDNNRDKEEEESAPLSLFTGQVLYYFEHDLRMKCLHCFAMVRYYRQLSSQHLGI
ncbi:hypothetical protein BDA99DRAFT_566852 [Phascolomyces articulosus]|uniref:Uncharacterized protein n=1 Tax=Phascolomyces articulosus TaxID=60185 RepID=A0AAD5JYI5_9FUNG|nr:hypothetical protein BDA99DRAFT_566852 [Phascolomyces articulosus]